MLTVKTANSLKSWNNESLLNRSSTRVNTDKKRDLRYKKCKEKHWQLLCHAQRQRVEKRLFRARARYPDSGKNIFIDRYTKGAVSKRFIPIELITAPILYPKMQNKNRGKHRLEKPISCFTAARPFSFQPFCFLSADCFHQISKSYSKTKEYWFCLTV